MTDHEPTAEELREAWCAFKHDYDMRHPGEFGAELQFYFDELTYMVVAVTGMGVYGLTTTVLAGFDSARDLIAWLKSHAESRREE